MWRNSLHNYAVLIPAIPNRPKQPDAPKHPFKAKAHNGIARRAGRSPDRREGSSRSRSRAALATCGSCKANGIVLWRSWWEPRGLMGYGKPSGVVRGECRGGLGGAAAPNRPPSAARREGGQNSAKKEAAAQAPKIINKEKASVPVGHKKSRKRDSIFFSRPQGTPPSFQYCTEQ